MSGRAPEHVWGAASAWHSTCYAFGTVLDKLKAHWRELKSYPIGKRFQTVNERQKGAPPWVRPLVIAGAVVAFGIGVLLSVLPGPAFVFYGIAAALAAIESKWVARALDRVEVNLRLLRKRWKARFKKHRRPAEAKS